MRIGISSWAYPWAVGVPGHQPERPLTAFDLVDRAAELEVGVLQVADNLPLHRMGEAELDRLLELARSSGVELEVGTIGFDPQHLLGYLGIARRLRSPFVRVVIDTLDHSPSDSEIGETLRTVTPAYERAGLKLLIENHDHRKAADLKRFLEESGSDALGICLDTLNSLGCHEPVDTVLDQLEPWVENVHVKDFTVERTNCRLAFLIEGAPISEGVLDISGLVSRLNASRGNDLSWIVELWPPRVEGGLEQTIAAERLWVERSVAHLRQSASD